MANDKKKVQIDIEGNASSLKASVEQSAGYVKSLVAQVALLVVQLVQSTAEFAKFSGGAVSAMGRAAMSVVSLTGQVVSLGFQIARLASNYLGLSVGIDTNNTKVEIARKAVEKYHAEIRISLGFLKAFADALKHLPFPVKPLVDFINLVAKMDIVLGIGRGKKINVFDALGDSIEKAQGMLQGLNKVVDAYSGHLKDRLAKLAAVFTIEALVEWRGIKFDAAFSEVRKVVDGTREQLATLRKDLLDMSTEVSTPVEGLTQMAAIAGQMGIPTNEMKEFVDLISESSVAFGLLPDQAAASMGKLRAIYGLNAKELRYFGDQINYVADNAKGAVSESGLLDVISYAGETAKGFGLLRSETIAMSATLLETGKAPDTVSTAIRNLLVSLQTAEQGTKPFQAALKQMGMDAKQLADNIAKDPKKALDDFLLTVKKFDPKGQTSLLSAMFGKGDDTEVIKTLIAQFDEYQRLVQAAQGQDAIGSMNKTFQEKEATAMAALSRLKNTIYALAVVASDIFLPAIVGVTNGLTSLVKWLKELNEQNPNALAFLRIAGTFGIIGSILRLTFGASSLGLIKSFVATAIAYFQGGFLPGIRAAILGIPALLGVVFESALGRLLGGTALLLGAFQVIPVVVGGVSTAISFLAGSPIALLVTALTVLGLKMAMSATLMAGLGSGLSVLGRGMLMLVGGPIGLVVSALVFLGIKFWEVKDKAVEFGGVTTSLGEILKGVWSLVSGVVGQAVDNIGGYLKAFGGWLAQLVGINEETWNRIVAKFGGSEADIGGNLKTIANIVAGTFDFIAQYTGIRLGQFVETIRIKMGNAVALAQAAGRDIQAALSGDFSGSNIKVTSQANTAKSKMVGEIADDSIKQSFTKTIGRDYVGELLGAATTVVAQEIKNQRAASQAAIMSAGGGVSAEKRPSGAGKALPDADDGSSKKGKKTKTPKEPEETDMHRFDLELENRKIAFEKENALLDFSKAQEKQYWVDVLATYKGNEKTRADIQKKISDLELQIIRESEKKKRELLKEQQQADYDAAAGDIAQKQAAAQQQQQLGIITQAELLALERQYAKESFAIALKLAQQKRDLTLAGTVDRAQAENAILQVVRDGAQKESAIVNSQVLERKQRFDQLFAPLTNALDQSVNGILTGQQTLSNALRNTAQSITISYIQEALKRRAVLAQNWLFEKLGYAKVGAEKMTIDKNVDIFDGLLWIGKKMRLAGQWAWDLLGFGAKETAKVGIKAGSETAQAGAVVAGEAIKAGAVAVGEGVQTAAVAAGESERSSITMLGTLKTIGAKAAQAAAGAFAWVMAEVPFPLNIILAPVVAAGAFLGTMAFGSMVSSKGGEWDVPEDRLQLVHKRETILPEWAAAPLRKLVMQGQPLAGGVADTMQSATDKASTAYSTVSNTAGQRITDTTESVKAVASTVRSLVSSTVQSVTDKTQSAYEVANKIKFAASGAVLPPNTRQIVADLALAGKIYPLQLPDSALAMRKTSAQAATQFAKEQYLVKRDQRKSDSERVRDRSKSGAGVQIFQLDINDFFGRHGNAIVKSVGKQLRNFNTGK